MDISRRNLTWTEAASGININCRHPSATGVLPAAWQVVPLMIVVALWRATTLPLLLLQSACSHGQVCWSAAPGRRVVRAVRLLYALAPLDKGVDCLLHAGESTGGAWRAALCWA